MPTFNPGEATHQRAREFIGPYSFETVYGTYIEKEEPRMLKELKHRGRSRPGYPPTLKPGFSGDVNREYLGWESRAFRFSADVAHVFRRGCVDRGLSVSAGAEQALAAWVMEGGAANPWETVARMRGEWSPLWLIRDMVGGIRLNPLVRDSFVEVYQRRPDAVDMSAAILFWEARPLGAGSEALRALERGEGPRLPSFAAIFGGQAQAQAQDSEAQALQAQAVVDLL
jgi:hypothetical protein